MSNRPIHILHLTSRWLRWATLEAGSTHVLKEVGEAEGEPARMLEEWVKRLSDRRATIRLYDGRPRYLTFVQNVPQRALAQKDNLIQLRLRQELGRGVETLYYASGVEPSSDSDSPCRATRESAFDRVTRWSAGAPSTRKTSTA